MNEALSSILAPQKQIKRTKKKMVNQVSPFEGLTRASYSTLLVLVNTQILASAVVKYAKAGCSNRETSSNVSSVRMWTMYTCSLCPSKDVKEMPSEDNKFGCRENMGSAL
jgi:hypothetical protein